MSDAEETVERPRSGGAPAKAPSPGEPPADGHGRRAEEPGAPVVATGPAGTPDGEALRGDLDELVAVAAQRDEYLALAQRTQADFENYRKRVAREASAAQERGKSSLAKELLPALDNLDRAIAAAAEEDPLLEGVRLVRSELAAGLARVGIESDSPLGEQFDPALHEAVATAPSPDGEASGTILEVYQAGYRIGGSVIRPARVVVAA